MFFESVRLWGHLNASSFRKIKNGKTAYNGELTKPHVNDKTD